MKKSAKVTVAFLSFIAAAVINGCNNDGAGDWVEAKRCANNNNVVVEDSWCQDPAPSLSRTGGGFHSYYYCGRGDYPGDLVSGGGHVPQGGVSYQSAGRVPSSSFGSTGKAFVSRGRSISS